MLILVVDALLIYLTISEILKLFKITYIGYLFAVNQGRCNI